MPFENEFASYKPLNRIVNNEKIEAIQSCMRTLHIEKKHLGELNNSYSLQDLGKSDWEADLIIATDGSYQNVPVENGFPGAEIGYVTTASVLILMDQLKKLDGQEFIDPKTFRETEKASTFDAVFPGCNIITDEDESPRCFLRRMVYEEFSKTQGFSEFETLLDTYEALLKLRDKDSKLPKNPLEELENEHEMQIGFGKYKCEKTGKQLYSTDALRFHELLNPSGTSGELFGQISFVLETLWLIHLLRAFEKKNWLSTLKNMAFIMDGSLAIYSVSAWLVKPMIKELQRINNLQKKINGTDLLIMGLEKSGRFVEHFNTLDISSTGEKGLFPNQSLLLLDDDYIKKNIIYSQSEKQYGKDTYFGRKFFYKTKNGYRIVAQCACFDNYQSNLSTAQPDQFPRLIDTCNLLDQIVSCQYANSITPLISAHAEAAIPLNLGKKIFDQIAMEIRNKSK